MLELEVKAFTNLKTKEYSKSTKKKDQKLILQLKGKKMKIQLNFQIKLLFNFRSRKVNQKSYKKHKKQMIFRIITL